MNRSKLAFRSVIKRILTLFIVIFVPVAVVVALIPSEYETVCTIAVLDSESTPTPSSGRVQELSRDQFLRVKYGLLDSRNLQAVISKLDIEPDQFPDPSWRSLAGRMGLNLNRTDGAGTYPAETLLDCIRHRIEVKPAGGNKINVGYTGSDNGFNVRLVNAIADQFVNGTNRSVGSSVRTDLTLLESDLARHRSEISDLERKVTDFENERISDLDSQIKTVSNDLEQYKKETRTVQKNNENLSARIDSIDGRIASLEKGVAPPPDPEVEQRVKGLTQTVAQMEVQLSKLKAAMTAKHPQVVAKERELAEIRKELDATRNTMGSAAIDNGSSRIAVDSLRELRTLLVGEKDRGSARIDTIKKETSEGEKRVQRLAADKKRIEHFVRQFSLNKGDHRTNIDRAKNDAENRLSSPLREYKIIERARSSVNPVGPNRVLLLVVGTLTCSFLYLVAVSSVKGFIRSSTVAVDISDRSLIKAGSTGIHERRQTVKRAAWYAVLTLVYCLVVFMLSSMNRRPGIMQTIDMVTRYNLAAHAVVYAGLGWLVGLTVRTGAIRMRAWLYWIVPILFVAAYGLINELNQWLILNLHSDMSDVSEWVADVVGGIVAQFAFLVTHKRKRNRTTD